MHFNLESISEPIGFWAVFDGHGGIFFMIFFKLFLLFIFIIIFIIYFYYYFYYLFLRCQMNLK